MEPVPASPVGTTPNQHCAFNDIRYLWTDGSYKPDPYAGAPKWGWIGAGGDTYLIDCSGMRSGSCRIGQSGPNSGDGFGLNGDPYAAGAPPPISGTSGAHTRILGVNYADCSTQGARTKINGGYGAQATLSLVGVAYVDISCFDISDHSNCGKAGQVSGCNTNFPLSDYSDDGIALSNTSTHDTLTHIRIHGMTNVGLYGPTGDGFTMQDIQILGNAGSGWNADNGTVGTGSC